MATTTKQRLALAVCDFLTTSLTDGTLPAEEKDSIDLAVNCIAESFGVDPTDKAAVQTALGSRNLAQVYSVYEEVRGAEPSTRSGNALASALSRAAGPGLEELKQADMLKSKGNAAMAAKDSAAAIDYYTQALELIPRNPIYLSNRAAAHSVAGDHARARADAEEAVAADPKYTKGWSRLGLACYALGDLKGAVDAYQKGIEYEGDGGSNAMKKGYETAKKRLEEQKDEKADTGDEASWDAGQDGGKSGNPLLAALAGMQGGGGGASRRGGGGGGGGMPNLSAIMNNPMFASMAQNLMSNPNMMQNLMSNPRLREMADRFGSGGGEMPDLGALMSDPSIADMARSMMGGGGNGGAGRGDGAPGSGG